MKQPVLQIVLALALGAVAFGEGEDVSMDDLSMFRVTKVCIPAPMSTIADRRPCYVLCERGQLFRIPVTELREHAKEKLQEITREVNGDTAELLRKLSVTRLRVGEFDIDLSFALVGQFAVQLDPDAIGLQASRELLENNPPEWLANTDPEEEMITLLLRCDSIQAFRAARKMARKRGIDVSFEVLDTGEPIKFGLGGSPIVTD